MSAFTEAFFHADSGDVFAGGDAQMGVEKLIQVFSERLSFAEVFGRRRVDDFGQNAVRSPEGNGQELNGMVRVLGVPGVAVDNHKVLSNQDHILSAYQIM